MTAARKEFLIEVVVEADTPPQRIDSYLGAHPTVNLTRSRIQKLMADRQILVNGQPVNKKHLVRPGDKIAVTVTPLPETTVVGENVTLDIVYEDDYLAVINKPAGMVTHPGVGNYVGTLVNALVYHFKKLPESSSPERPGIVHRLDKDTSGLLVIAKDEEVFVALQTALAAREIKRTYLAVVCGHLKEEEGTMDLPIGRSHRDRTKMIVTNVASKPSVTHYRVLKRYRSYDLVEARLETGRTHQIRVHFAHMGHPVLGDPEYGGREKWHRGMFAPERPLGKKLLATIPRQALHARQLEFVHPKLQTLIKLSSEPPADFLAVLKLLDEAGS